MNKKKLNLLQTAKEIRMNELLKSGLNETDAIAKVEEETNAYMEMYQNAISTTTTSGNAKELIAPSVTMGELIDLGKKFSELSLLNIFKQQMVKSQTNEYPIVGTQNEAVVVEEYTGSTDFRYKNPSNSLNTAKAKIELKKLVGQFLITKELIRYSVADLMPIVAAQLSKAVGIALLRGIICGDSALTLNVNNDGGTIVLDPQVNPAWLKMDNGLIKQALANNALDLGVLDGFNDVASLLATLTFDLGTEGGKVIIMDQATYWKLMTKDDFKNQAVNGKASTINTGAITNIGGYDVFVTDMIKKAAANGKVSSTAGNNTTGRILALDGVVIQYYVDPTIEIDMEYDVVNGYKFTGVGFGGFDNISGKVDGNKLVALGYNCQ